MRTIIWILVWTLVVMALLVGAGWGWYRQRLVVTIPVAKSSTRSAPVIGSSVGKEETDASKLLFHYLTVREADNVGRLLKDHPELLEKPINGQPPVFVAAEKGSLALVKTFVERGANLKARSKAGQTVLRPAVASDNVSLVKYLIEKGGDPKALQDDGESLLWAAESKEMAELLIAAGVDPKHRSNLGDTALHVAAHHSLKDVVQVLLDHGLDVESKGRWNMPPLHRAAATVTGDPRSVVLLLLERGADINSRGYKGHTVIHECAFYNLYDTAVLLVSRGAEVDVKDDEGKTPLDIAKAVGAADRQRLINLLIKRGAKGDPTDVIKPIPPGK